MHEQLRASNRPVALAEALADHLGDGVDEEGHEKEDPRRQEQHPIEGASVGSLRDLHRDVGGERAHAVEDRPVEDRGVAGGHEHDHGLPHRPPEADHHRREDAGARGGEHHPGGGLPPAGSQGQGGGGQVRGDAREGVLRDREDDRDHREAHGDAHHHAVALVVDEVEGRLQPELEVAAEEQGLDGGADLHGHHPAQHEQGQDQRDLHAGLQPARSEEHTSELQSRENLVCRLLLEKKKKKNNIILCINKKKKKKKIKKKKTNY